MKKKFTWSTWYKLVSTSCTTSAGWGQGHCRGLPRPRWHSSATITTTAATTDVDDSMHSSRNISARVGRADLRQGLVAANR